MRRRVHRAGNFQSGAAKNCPQHDSEQHRDQKGPVTQPLRHKGDECPKRRDSDGERHPSCARKPVHGRRGAPGGERFGVHSRPNILAEKSQIFAQLNPLS